MTFAWTNEQREIVEAPVELRLLVEAGPGTGKTAVACGRVARLLGAGLNPSAILMVSFTRTAVAEMKSRIALWAEAGQVGAVNICTLDQAAFSFGLGCGQRFEKLMGSFEGNIHSTLRHFARQDPLLLDYMRAFRHVIIDEAQDLLGVRSRLATCLLESLDPEAGVTVFGDPAQAIYGFSQGAPSTDAAENFLRSFAAAEHGFERRRLTQIHRSAHPPILKLFSGSRTALDSQATGVAKVRGVIEAAESSVASSGDDVKRLGALPGDLLLYRKRASALMHAVHCPQLFRLRLPGHPAPIFPWIGLALSGCPEPMLTEPDFAAQWQESVPQGMDDGFTAQTAWELLHRFAGKRGEVDLARLRHLLSQPRPRVEFCQLDYGGSGPIFGTIHASKGREADRVFLMLPRSLDYLEKSASMDAEEEARVYYVGATRVRKEFLRGTAHSLAGSQRLEAGNERIVQVLAEEKLKFQIGLARDFDDLAAVGRDPFFCPSALAAREHQQRLVRVWRRCLERGTPGDVTAGTMPRPDGSEWPWSFRCEDDELLAWSGEPFVRDLWKMHALVEKRFHGPRVLPRTIKHLRLIGLRTRALAEDDPGLGRLHEPHASSGFWVAPMIVGFQPVYFNLRKSEHR